MDVVDSLEREKGVFRSMLPELRKKYEGKYVAIKDGAVISVGSSKEETAFKAYEKVGYSVIYVGYVGEEREIGLPSPRVIR